jgi:hypothetical protein
MFDAHKLLAAFERPTYVTRAGETVTGVPLSHVQYERALADLRAVGEDRAAAEQIVKQALCDMQLPADEILALPDPLYWGAIADFFRCCRGEPAAPSTPSPAPAAPATAPATP